ncbi:hypothetical protein PFISCL1PPCAC_4903, partial [Pristionchus fissidentatus]
IDKKVREMSSIRKPTATSKSSAYGGRLKSSRNGGLSFEVDQMYTTMQKGHSVYKIALLKKWDRDQKFLSLNMDTRQICLTKPGAAPMTLDLRYVKEAHTLDFKLHTVSITDKWTKDKELRTANAIHVLLIAHGHGFNLSYWILYFNDKGEAAAVWAQGINHIVAETIAAPHPMVINRWMRKQYNALALMPNSEISIKHMKPFTQTTLQCKVQTKFLQELMKPNMNFADFETATRAMITNNSPIFLNFFAELCEDGQNVTFPNFRRFLRDFQFDEMHTSRERTNEFLRKYLAGPSQPKHSHGIDQSLSVNQFNDLLFARENSLWDPMNEKVVHDMSRPLSHYWIASSHNTYLTGDQLRSESSLDSYARALMMGCRCIELDCWDGTRKNNSQEVVDIVIYHGYTMTSKLQLRDVLFTIKHYAFMNSDFPVILSIEDNCSVQAQRILAHDIKEILGDLLLTQPVSREETQLPSPLSMKRKIIIKHKKLALESEDLTISPNDDFQDTDLMDKECVKRGMMMMRNPTTNEWTSHIFILFHDRLCYTIETYNENESKQQEDSVSVMGDDEQPPEEQMSGFGVRPEEMHVTEEWFHGKCDRQTAVVRLMEHTDKGNGLFLVRDSTIFIGDFSLSFLHEGKVYHCRIKTKMKEGEKKYYFLEGVEMDTLFELICHYMKVALTTPNFSTNLILPCPQPQPHLTEPWFSPTATQKTAEEMLAKVPEDGAFLVRYSSGDQSVFVLSVRLDGVTCHFRLKRNGRIFVVNQTVFETLNQIVEYYSSRDFIRGTSLKFPVNEKSIEMYANSVGEAAPGCYLDIATFDQNIQARALRPYQGEKVEQLSFPANAIITVLKKDGQLWRGKYEGKVGWFPPSFVQEISPQDKKGEKDAYATIELAGALVERMTSSESHDRPNVLRITHASQHWTGQQWLVAAATIEDADDWSNNLTEILRTANEKISNLRTKEKTARIASELSNLVVYCQAVPFNPARIRDGSFYEMCSFSESKLEKILEKGLVQFNSRQLSRVYPQGTRVTSTNFSPIPMWNAGCHMVALNYQTGDKAMQVNNGKFLTNGRCGYVLKPQYMLDDAFDPQQGSKVSTSVPIQLSVKVIAGRHLSRKDKNKGICSPFVEIEILGLQCDERSVKTNTITSNGLNPYWNEQFVFQIHCPEIALLRFVAEDGDFVGPKTDPFIGQAVFPIDSIRSGYRSVTLKNQYSEELELSSLLVHVEITPLVDKGPTNMSPHALLQASRSVYATARSASTTSAPYSPPPFQKTPSLDQKVGPSRMTSLDVPPAAEAPAAPRERNLSVDEKKKNGKPLFKKILSFGRKDSH